MKRHGFHVLSFTAGVVFVGLAIAFLAAGDDVIAQRRWVWPLLLLTLGAAGVVAVLRREDS